MLTLPPSECRPLIGLLIRPNNVHEIGYSYSRGAAMAAELLGATVVISDDPEVFRDVERFLGFIDCTAHGQSLELFEAFRARGLPAISLDGKVDQATASVLHYGKKCFWIFTRRLIEEGHQKIAFLGGVDGFSHNTARLNGYLEAHAEYGQPVDPGLIGHVGYWGIDEIRRHIGAVFDPTGDFDAVVCASDALALVVMEQLREAGRNVPEDVSVFGYDNFAFRYRIDPALSDPPLTCGIYPAFEMGYRAVELVIEASRGGVIPDEVFIQPGIAERASSMSRNDCREPSPLDHDFGPNVSFRKSSQIIADLEAILPEAANPAEALGSYLRAMIRAGYNDFLGFAIFEGIYRRMKTSRFCDASPEERNLRLHKLLTPLRLEAISGHYRDFHLSQISRLEDALASHRYVTLTLQSRADVMNLVDGVRHDLGIESLCVEFIGERRDAWLCVEGEGVRHWGDKNLEGLYAILLQDSLVMKTISLEEYPIARLYVDYGVSREIDMERLADFIAAASLQAQTSCTLRTRATELAQEKRNAEVARDDAQKANRAKSSFLAMMSHEIRTPMNGVIGCTSLLQNTELSEDQLEFVRTIQTSGENLLVIINEILDFSKIEAGKIELEVIGFNLQECIEDAHDLFSAEASTKGLELAFEIDPDVPLGLLGDVTRVRQILVNLIGNSIKFTEHGEVVTRVKIISLDVAERTCRLQFSITDTGIGIPAEAVETLFSPFNQADASTTRRYGGTGLGLTISKLLSEMMDGGISVESEVGKGSTFTFNIALGLDTRQVDASRLKDTPIAGRRVLVVDDNTTNRKILCDQLLQWGLVAVAFNDPKEAITHVRAGHTYDIGLFDYHMPEMDGVSLARIIHTLPGQSELPVIILSSAAGEVRPGYDIAVVLRKPPKAKQLRYELVRLLGKASGRSVRNPVRERVTTAAVRNGLRILVAEDNSVNQRVIGVMLKRLGYENVVMVADGDEAVVAATEGRFDIILMDVNMPRLDGLDATRQIRSRIEADSDRPVVLGLSAGAMGGDRENALAAGMDGYLTKPIKVEELQIVLQNLVGTLEPID